jgi:hypothetical protein
VLLWRGPTGPSGQRASESLYATVEGLKGGSKRSYSANVTILKAVEVQTQPMCLPCSGSVAGLACHLITLHYRLRQHHHVQDTAKTLAGSDLWLLTFSDRPHHVCMVLRCEQMRVLGCVGLCNFHNTSDLP